MNPFRRLRARGIIGMNERNGNYIQRHNPRSLFPLVDDKLRSKALAEAAGIAVPRLFGVVETNRQARQVERLLQGHDDFVIKPAAGSGGNGILVISGRVGPYFRRSNGALISVDDIGHHATHILSGMHSLGGVPDRAMIEERVECDSYFDRISYQGVPDVRVVVYRGIPVMAMIRLPTRASDGKANLALGGVGVGIDIGSGRTIGAVCGDRQILHHPDTLEPLIDLEIPGWHELLILSAHCQSLCGLGYLGVDLVLDARRGPLVLELNARPGLSVQLANQRGLRLRLDQVDALPSIPADPELRAGLARELAGESLTEAEASLERLARTA
jgi:alpha-L-glutamate ligase-like protein